MRRIVCIWFPQLAAERVSRANPHWRDRPLVFTGADGTRLCIMAVNHAAAQLGIAPGMTLTDVRAACPDILTHPAEPVHDAALLKRLLRWAVRYTPLAARADHDCLMLDVTGSAHLFGGEEALLHALPRRLRRFGFSARVALAETPAAAWALAHFGGEVSLVPPGSLPEAVAPLPVEALRIGAAQAVLCRQLGLGTIGALLQRPRAPLAARLGLEVIRSLDRLVGEEKEPIRPARHRRAWVETRGFAEPVGRSEDILAALEDLLARLCARLAHRALGLRRARLTLERADHHALEFEIGTVAASHDAAALLRLFARHLESLDAGFGIEQMTLAASGVDSITQAQAGLQDGADAHGADRLIDTLVNMLGFERVLRFAPAQSHIPERGFIMASALYGETEPPPWPGSAHRRPLRLFKTPQPVSSNAPGDALAPPEEIVWQGAAQKLAVLEGPERIEPEWWFDDPDWRSGARDYWWALTATGALLWLFRTDGPGGASRWFVHGLGS